MDSQEKLEILADAGKYDLACSCGGTGKEGIPGEIAPDPDILIREHRLYQTDFLIRKIRLWQGGYSIGNL